MRTPAFCVVLLVVLSVAGAQAAGPAGAYGFINKVVLEPNVDNPERIQLWGTFSIAAGTTGDYHAPESGYLYFDLPRDSDAALRDWRQLKKISDAGSLIDIAVGTAIKGIVAFGRPGMKARVRTSDESLGDPDTYRHSGDGVVVGGYDNTSRGVQLLGSTLKPLHRYNYARVDKVLVEPNSASPQRIQIWGAFEMGKSGSSFGAIQRGYLYLTLPFDKSTAQSLVNDWMQIAGTHNIVGFYIMTYMNKDIRVRGANEQPDVPDSYDPVRKDPNVIRSDTEYIPVKLLRDLRD